MAKIDALFKILREKGGSDLHLSPGNPPLLRVSGHLTPAVPQKLGHEQYKALIYEMMSEEKRKRFEERLDLDFAYEVTKLGISAVFRLIPTRILTA